MAKASARRASDDKLERLQDFVDNLWFEARSFDLESMTAERLREGIRRMAAASQPLISPALAAVLDPEVETNDLYVEGRLATGFDDLLGRAAEASGFAEPPIDRVYMRGQGDKLIDVTTMDQDFNRTLVDHQDDDDFVFITKEQVTPCKACSGTGETIEFPPDDDERMVACPACGGTGEAITL